MRIFTDIATHDTAGVAPGGRIIRTDSSPEEGDVTPVNGKFIFTVPRALRWRSTRRRSTSRRRMPTASRRAPQRSS